MLFRRHILAFVFAARVMGGGWAVARAGCGRARSDEVRGAAGRVGRGRARRRAARRAGGGDLARARLRSRRARRSRPCACASLCRRSSTRSAWRTRASRRRRRRRARSPCASSSGRRCGSRPRALTSTRRRGTDLAADDIPLAPQPARHRRAPLRAGPAHERRSHPSLPARPRLLPRRSDARGRARPGGHGRDRHLPRRARRAGAG